jgi:hypothetical protein
VSLRGVWFAGTEAFAIRHRVRSASVGAVSAATIGVQLFTMFVIHTSQIHSFELVAMNVFASRMIVHVKQHFPDRCRALGEEEIRELVARGIDRAASHGFTSERDVCKYLNLVFFFGLDFDVAPSIGWARPILGASGFTSPGEKMAALHLAAEDAARAAWSKE